MPRLRETKEEKAAHAAEAAREAAEINGAISEALDHWRRTIELRGVDADAHLLFRNAAIELHRLLKIDRTVHPETHARTRQTVFDKLAEMADIGSIKPDDAQNILAGIVKQELPEDEAATDAFGITFHTSTKATARLTDHGPAHPRASKAGHAGDGSAAALVDRRQRLCAQPRRMGHISPVCKIHADRSRTGSIAAHSIGEGRTQAASRGDDDEN